MPNAVLPRHGKPPLELYVPDGVTKDQNYSRILKKRNKRKGNLKMVLWRPRKWNKRDGNDENSHKEIYKLGDSHKT